VNEELMRKYLVIIEKTESGYAAYAPDLPGCVATGATRDDVSANLKEAIGFHLEGLKEAGLPVPAAASESAYLDIVS
jgi:predicted RNase H-like HicB family nuclease